MPPAGGFTATATKTQKDAVSGGGSKGSVTTLSTALPRYAELQKQRDLAEASGFKLKATVKAMVLGDETARTLVAGPQRRWNSIYYRPNCDFHDGALIASTPK